MGDFEFDIDLLISLVEARGDKTDDIYKDKRKPKRHGEKFLFVFKKTSKL